MVLLVTLPEATPIHEAMELERDLARAEITPFAWVVNQSLTALEVTDPVLRACGGVMKPSTFESWRPTGSAPRSNRGMPTSSRCLVEPSLLGIARLLRHAVFRRARREVKTLESKSQETLFRTEHTEGPARLELHDAREFPVAQEGVVPSVQRVLAVAHTSRLRLDEPGLRSRGDGN